MSAQLILLIIAVAREAPELLAAIQELIHSGEGASLEFIERWAKRLEESTAERNRVIREAEERRERERERRATPDPDR